MRREGLQKVTEACQQASHGAEGLALTGRAIFGGLCGSNVGLTGVTSLLARTLSLALLLTTGPTLPPDCPGKLPFLPPPTPRGTSTGNLGNPAALAAAKDLIASGDGGENAIVGEGYVVEPCEGLKGAPSWGEGSR